MFMILNQAKRCILFRAYINRCKIKKKNKDLNESVEAIESMADDFDEILPRYIVVFRK